MQQWIRENGNWFNNSNSMPLSPSLIKTRKLLDLLRQSLKAISKNTDFEMLNGQIKLSKNTLYYKLHQKFPISLLFSSVQFSRSVVSDSLQPHELQHARPPCPSPTLGVHSNSTSIESMMPSSHLTLCRPLLLLPQSLPASESFPMSQLFT